jgi:hypothetical protein
MDGFDLIEMVVEHRIISMDGYIRFRAIRFLVCC